MENRLPKIVISAISTVLGLIMSVRMVNTYSNRIHERNTGDDDFLKVMVGSTDEGVSFRLSMK